MIGFLMAAALTCGVDCSRAEKASALCSGRQGVHYFGRENVLCIDGPVDLEGHLRGAVLRQPVRRGVVAVVRSAGGGLAHAIDIAEHLRRFHYSIIVDGICASACAQFLFMAAERKVIRGEGAVGMHGGPFTDAQIAALDLSPKARENVRRETRRFVDFYRRLGIGIGITNDFPPDLREQRAQGRLVFWIAEEADYRRFNVRGVTYCSARAPDNLPSAPGGATPPPSSAEISAAREGVVHADAQGREHLPALGRPLSR